MFVKLYTRRGDTVAMAFYDPEVADSSPGCDGRVMMGAKCENTRVMRLPVHATELKAVKINIEPSTTESLTAPIRYFGLLNTSNQSINQ